MLTNLWGYLINVKFSGNIEAKLNIYEFPVKNEGGQAEHYRVVSSIVRSKYYFN